jgi:predicted Zn finger-like uncharacterized protein
MILTCPECATSYFVDDLRIPRLGRMVKCTTCGARWRAFQDRHEPEKAAPEDDLIVEAPTPEPEPVDDDIDFVAAPVMPARKPEKKKTPVGLAIAAGVLVALGVAGGAAVLMRQQIADAMPATAPVFAAIGLPVNTLGLVLDAKATPMTQGGRPVWSVTGSVRNVRDEAVVSPPIRLTLLNAGGEELATMVAQTQNARVPPGATRYFAITMPNPPSGGAKMKVDLAVAHGAPAADHKAQLSATPVGPEAAAHPPEPAEAQPLPADSPDALHAPEKNEQH